MQIRIEVQLRPDRHEGGLLTVYDTLTGLQALMPIPCLGRASTGSPPSTQVNGRTPTGDYDVTGIKPAGTTPDDLAKYGYHPRLMLKGVAGDARVREQVSPNQLRIHGGHMSNGALMATQGCIRVADVDMKTLLDFLETNGVQFPFQMTVVESANPPAIVSGEDANLLGAPT